MACGATAVLGPGSDLGDEMRAALGAAACAHERPAADAREAAAPHRPRDPIAGRVVALLGEVRPDPGHAVRAPAAGVGAPDLLGEARVGALPGGRAA